MDIVTHIIRGLVSNPTQASNQTKRDILETNVNMLVENYQITDETINLFLNYLDKQPNKSRDYPLLVNALKKAKAKTSWWETIIGWFT